jgi:hypothetical protein
MTIKFSFVVVTWQKAFKHIKISSVSMFQSQCLLTGSNRELKSISEVPDSSLVGCSTVSTGERRFSAGDIVYIVRIQQWKNNGKISFIYQLLATYVR